MVTITKKRILKKNSVYVTIYTETLILIDLMQQNGKKMNRKRIRTILMNCCSNFD